MDAIIDYFIPTYLNNEDLYALIDFIKTENLSKDDFKIQVKSNTFIIFYNDKKYSIMNGVINLLI